MTEKLKCPFCGSELQHWGEDFLYCENLGCPMSPQIELPISIWQALIDGKKAQDALKSIADDMVLYRPALDLQNNIPWKKHYFRLKNQARSAITSITKQEE